MAVSCFQGCGPCEATHDPVDGPAPMHVLAAQCALHGLFLRKGHMKLGANTGIEEGVRALIKTNVCMKFSDKRKAKAK